MKTVRERVLEQIGLQEEIQRVSSITIVNCGNCGSVVLHKMEADQHKDIVCPYCSFKSDPCDFPDFLYRGMESSEIFDEPEVTGEEVVIEVTIFAKNSTFIAQERVSFEKKPTKIEIRNKLRMFKEKGANYMRVRMPKGNLKFYKL